MHGNGYFIMNNLCSLKAPISFNITSETLATLTWPFKVLPLVTLWLHFLPHILTLFQSSRTSYSFLNMFALSLSVLFSLYLSQLFMSTWNTFFLHSVLCSNVTTLERMTMLAKNNTLSVSVFILFLCLFGEVITILHSYLFTYCLSLHQEDKLPRVVTST